MAHVNKLVAGDPAPEFILPDQSGTEHHLSDYRGRWVVLYFYPKDDTPGCTAEACSFRDDILQLRDLDVVVLGVSLDSRESHSAFADKHVLPFPLLSDERAEVSELYDTLFSLGPLMFAKRHTFLIDPEGKVAKVYRKVKAKVHSDQVIADLKSLEVKH